MNTNGTRKLIGDEQHDAFHAAISGHQNWDLIDPLIVCTHSFGSRVAQVLLRQVPVLLLVACNVNV